MKINKSINIENFIIKSGANLKLEETITVNDVEKWHKDFQAFTKNIRRIKTREDIEIVAEALETYSKNLETFFYGSMLGFHGSEYVTSYNNYDDANLSDYIKDAKEVVWSLTTFLRRISSDFISKNYYGIGAITYDGSIPIFIETYKKGKIFFDKYIDSVYQKLTRLGREAFDSMRGIFDIKSELLDLFITENMKIQGIPTIVTYQEAEFDKFKDTLNKIEKDIAIINKLCNKKGFKSIYDGLTLIVDTQRSGITKQDRSSSYAGGAGAFFNIADMTINIWTSDIYMLAHELGHKYYFYNMYTEQQNIWKDFIEKNTISLVKSDLEVMATKIGNAIFDYYDELNNKDINPYMTSSEKSQKLSVYIEKNMNRFSLTDVEYAILDITNSVKGHLSDKWGLLFPYMNNEYTKLDLDFLISRIVSTTEYVGYYGKGSYNDVFHITSKEFYISDYANMNDREAYAETFAHYILDDIELPDLVLSQFYFTKPI